MQKTLLNLGSPVPLYFQLQELLSARIEEGKLLPGDLLPTEGELSAQFSVSRATVREALRGLAERGLIEKRQGVGSFVAARKINEVLPGLTSFSTEMRSRGFHVTSKVLSQELTVPPHRVLKALNLPADSQVLRVVRLRFVDNKPFLISTSHLVPEVSIEEDFSGSLYELFEAKYGYKIATGQATIEAGLADEREAHLLELQPRDAVLRITWLAETDTGLPLEYSETTYSGHRYRYIVQLRR